MTQHDSLAPFLSHLAATGLEAHRSADLAPAQLIMIRPVDWGILAHDAKAMDFRWVGIWADDWDQAGVDPGKGSFCVNACFEKAGAYLVARTTVPHSKPELASHAAYFAGADRPERHIRDLFGMVFTGHPDARPWTRHQAWKDCDFPLRQGFPVKGTPVAQTPADWQYDFLLAQGSGVYEIPVGPVHAGIIEPGHFRFQAVGETVLRLEERLGYTHKGIEKIAQGRDAPGLARLAARVSGDSTVAHTWAACMAMERAVGLGVPPRALWLRALMCERERVANHAGDMGAMLNDIGFAFGAVQFGRLRESWQRVSHEVFGHRFMMDCVVPGGVKIDIDPRFIAVMRAETGVMRLQVNKLMSIINDLPSVEDRVRGTGVLTPAHAKSLGCLGYVGRASGLNFDVRRDAPYAPYDQLSVKVPLHHYGDVNGRARTRLEEMAASFDLIESLLAGLPAGAVNAVWPGTSTGAEGVGLVEGWRGEILTYVRFSSDGQVGRFFPRDPSWTTWPALELLVHDNIVPDFPVCNKSVNGSYSGQDL
jgi:Ni,Fe-hydrogenase III large subunit